MAGTIVVDRIESDGSYSSKVNVVSPVNFASTTQIGGIDSSLSGFRNKVHNGSFNVQQKSNTSVQLKPTGTYYSYFVDRFAVATNVLGANTTVTLSTDVPNQTFANSLVYTVDTANTSSQPSNQYALYASHNIEGYDAIEFAWGTADAKDATLSFWIKAPLTGDYCVALRSSSYDLSFNTTYTVNQADTWEYKTIVIPGPTTGTWYRDNRQGILISWDAGYCGPSYPVDISTRGTWQSGDHVGFSSGTIQLSRNSSAVGKSIKITGIQFEMGRTATPFERRPYSTELNLCQRFFYRHSTSYNYLPAIVRLTNVVRSYFPFPVEMRAVPSFSAPTVTNGYNFICTNGDYQANSLELATASTRHVFVSHTSSSMPSNGAGFFQLQNGAYFELSAEI